MYMAKFDSNSSYFNIRLRAIGIPAKLITVLQLHEEIKKSQKVIQKKIQKNIFIKFPKYNK